MLPAAARLRLREDFSLVVRRGRRAGRGTLVAHYLPADPSRRADAAGAGDVVSDAAVPARAGGGQTGPAGTPRAGFVVGRAVGGSVVRHRVVRRLRHLVRDRLRQLPPGSRLVVRALPAAATADSAALAGDLDAALGRLLDPAPLAGSGSGEGEVSR